MLSKFVIVPNKTNIQASLWRPEQIFKWTTCIVENNEFFSGEVVQVKVFVEDKLIAL